MAVKKQKAAPSARETCPAIAPAATPEQIEKARELYQTEDVEIDGNATVSDAMPEGVWVSAWVWLEADNA